MNDSLGLYSTKNGTRKFFRKFEALEAAKGCAPCIRFHWNEMFWAAQDWLHPTAESLSALYKRRVTQLRKKYDYLILCYSGGADSWNILRTFDETNTPLDEVVSYHDVGFTGTKDSILSAEVFYTAVPKMKDFIARHPRTKHTLIDSRDVLPAYYARAADPLEDFFGLVNTFSHPLRRGYWLHTQERFRALAETKKVGIVWGHDKPVILDDAGVPSFAFHDAHVYTLRRRFFFPDLDIHDELFYWSPELPEMLVKQAHAAIGTPNSDVLNLRLYPGWNPFTINQSKWIGPRYFQAMDHWVLGHANDETVIAWREAVARGLKFYTGDKPNTVTYGRRYALR